MTALIGGGSTAQELSLGPFTGAEFLRSPDITNVINIRASYSAEAEAWIDERRYALTPTTLTFCSP